MLAHRTGCHLLLALGVVLAFGGCRQLAVTDRTREPAPTPPAGAPEQAGGAGYVFGWGSRPAELARPRGGTTHGTPVTLAEAAKLPLPAIAATTSALERDRAAILALAGDFRTSFHFLETLGLEPDHTPGRPYHSWATEHVRVIEDTGRRISLQHILVMFFAGSDGTASEPSVVKHWRQDWTYEDTDLHTFRGNRTWARERRAPETVSGTWSQAVYHVDDSPRYEAVGRWTHAGNRSVWTGETAWRPLPRRELSVRDDYDVLEGRHQIVITPTGWLHVQDNWKRVAGEPNGPQTAENHAPEYLAHEYGLDRYERITAPSLTAADAYWERTGGYWAAVRAAWREVYARHDRFSLAAAVDGERLFEVHFAYADALAAGERAFAADSAAQHARGTIARFLRPGE